MVHFCMWDLRSSVSGLVSAIALSSLVACTSADTKPDLQRDLEGMETATLRQELLTLPYGFRPLSHEPIPQPTNGNIINNAAAIRLGKAFFWDSQSGSDGQVACATCHASFGADARRINVLNPGPDRIYASGGVTGPGQLFTPQLITNDDVVGSQGVSLRIFESINPDPTIADETCAPIVDAVFGTERRVEFRQAPMIYGAVFFRQLFWAGEANHQFNGLTIWGLNGNNLAGPPIANMDNSALASQASGPPSNTTEMRCFRRPINGPNSLGSKMLARQPLQFQRVSPTDSVLGALANRNGPGLICDGVPCNYRSMIEQAFGPEMAANAENIFSLIWGEAIQAYQTTLVPDQTPFDRFLGGNLSALTPRQIFGLIRFVGKGKCAVCHAGPMLSDATVSFYNANGPLNRDGGDQGFHNIGLFNSDGDGGRGVVGPGNVPISESQSLFDDWAFKTPTLRNVGLTAPYFHSGTNPTLQDVMDFYIRGGDFPNPQLSADIVPLDLTEFDTRAIIDFMSNGLTDCRVEKRRAPFDHPELVVPNGPHLSAVGAEGIGPCRSGRW
jgi:cytochrome c peroxidase